MKRLAALAVGAAVLAALAGCPAQSDTTPAPSPTPTVRLTSPGETLGSAAAETAASALPRVSTPRKLPTRTTTTGPTPTTGEADPTEPVTGAGYDSCAEVRHDYPTGVPDEHPAYEKRFDPDNDGWACEVGP